MITRGFLTYTVFLLFVGEAVYVVLFFNGYSNPVADFFAWLAMFVIYLVAMSGRIGGP